jgi:cilia- and flagella-associated protein 52
MDVKLASVRRIVLCLDITPDDKFAYCGTTTGDILKISIDRNDIQSYNDPDTTVPSLIACSKDKSSKGVKALLCITNPTTGKTNFIVGAGDGSMTFMNPQLSVVAGHKTQLMGGVTSICKDPSGEKLIIGTDQCNRYEVSLDLARAELKASCHYGTCVVYVLMTHVHTYTHINMHIVAAVYVLVYFVRLSTSMSNTKTNTVLFST